MKKILGILLLTIILAGCNHIELQSLWKDFDIEIDGKDEDWDEAKIYIKEKNLVVAVANDDEFLYLCFYPTTNQSVKQVLKQGISFWFNADGKKKGNNGITYPLPLKDRDLDENKSEQSRERHGNSGRGNSSSELEKMVYNIKLRNSDVKISTPDGGNEVPLPSLIGMEIFMDAKNGVFVYEAKIPLNDPNASFSLGVEPGSELMIGIRSDAIERENNMDNGDMDMSGDMDGSSGGKGSGSRGGGGGGGGRSGGGSKGGGGKGGGARTGGMNTSNDLRLWANVKLATNPR